MKNVDENKENIRSFMKLYSKNPNFIFIYNTRYDSRFRVFMVQESDFNKVSLIRLIIEEEKNNENIETLIQLLCLCFIHPTEISNEYISEYSEPLKNMIFQSLIFILLMNNGDKENIKIVEDICNVLK